MNASGPQMPFSYDEEDAMRIYGDIIGFRRPKSLRPPMPRADRAAQFAPFAALTGHGDAVREAARYVAPRQALDDREQAAMDRALERLTQAITQAHGNETALPSITATCFVADPLKEGGTYREVQGVVRVIDIVLGNLVFTDGTIVELESLQSLRLD